MMKRITASTKPAITVFFKFVSMAAIFRPLSWGDTRTRLKPTPLRVVRRCDRLEISLSIMNRRVALAKPHRLLSLAIAFGVWRVW
jgi:hypothetical protein